MNQHYYIAIVTLLFYFLLSQFKKDIKTGSQKNFIYILFIPLIFYTYLYLFNNSEINSNQSFWQPQTSKPISISQKSSDLMSNMYPLSSEL